MYDQYRSDAQNGNPWTKYTVQDLIDKKYIDPPMDGNHGELHPKASDYVATGIPFVMANNLSDGFVDLSQCAFITEKQAKTLRKGFARPDDVLLTHKATLGRTAIVPEGYEYIILTPQVTYYRVHKGLSNVYLRYYFESKTARRAEIVSCTMAAAPTTVGTPIAITGTPRLSFVRL